MRVKREGVRERLAAGTVVTGVIVFTGSPVIVELSAAAGLDFVILDMEHSVLDLGTDADLFVNSVTRFSGLMGDAAS